MVRALEFSHSQDPKATSGMGTRLCFAKQPREAMPADKAGVQSSHQQPAFATDNASSRKQLTGRADGIFGNDRLFYHPCFATRLGGVSGGKETQGWRDSSHTAMVGAGKFWSAKLPMATATYPGKPSLSQ